MKGLRGFISICLTVCLLLSSNSNVVTDAQINESYLSEFTDEQLVHAIADYPYLVDIYAYGSMEEGLQIFSEYCSAYSELLKRDNGYEAFVKYGNELVASYKNNPREDGRTDFVSMAILDIIDTLSIEQTDSNDLSETPVAIHVFSQEDMIVTPAINEYDFATAQETGTIKKLQGMLPGAAEGTWYIVETDGIEYYYGTDDTFEEATLFGYSIISDQYSLANGITVGMTKDELLAEYPDMAVMDFEGNFLDEEVSPCLGWNNTAYPRSYVGMDDEWNYDGEDYYWENQFDYIMLADINLGTDDTLPSYVGLLMKDDMVSAITFYYPTAG